VSGCRYGDTPISKSEAIRRGLSRAIYVTLNDMKERIFAPGTIVQHFKRETLGEEELRGNKYLYEIIGEATDSETREKVICHSTHHEQRN